MKYLGWILMVAVLIVNVASADRHTTYLPVVQAAGEAEEEAPAIRDLYGLPVINTDPFHCDGQQHEKTWENDLGQTIYIRKAELWMGMDRHGVADYWVWLVRNPRASMLGHTNWDHYTEPDNIHNLRYSYAPDAIVLHPGERLKLRYGCSNIENSPRGHVTVTIWYVRGSGDM